MQLLLIILDSLSSCLMLNSSSLWHEPVFCSTFEQYLKQQSLSLCLQTLQIMEQLIFFPPPNILPHPQRRNMEIVPFLA